MARPLDRVTGPLAAGQRGGVRDQLRVRALRYYGLVFVLFAVPMALLIGLGTGLSAGSASTGVWSGLAAGGLGGAVVAVLLGTADVLVGDRGARPGEPHAPRQSATVPVPDGPELPQRIPSALLAPGGELASADDVAGRYTVRTRMTWRSFGERVTVQLTGGPAEPLAQVSSEPVAPTTLIDYGKGRRNVHRVVAALRGPGRSDPLLPQGPAGSRLRCSAPTSPYG